MVNENCMHSTFCLVDKKGICLPVMVYNLAEGKGVIIGDSVAIPEPYIAEVKFSYNNKVIIIHLHEVIRFFSIIVHP